DWSRRREAHRREQVTAQASCESAEEVRRRGRDDDDVGPTCELDVPHRSFRVRVPKIVPNTPARNRLERQWTDELARTMRHDDLNFAAALDEATHELRRLV